MITPAQCRAARAWLNLSQDELANMGTLSRATIARFEGGNSIMDFLVLEIAHALEGRGIVFLAHYGGAHGSARGIAGPDVPPTEPKDGK